MSERPPRRHQICQAAIALAARGGSHALTHETIDAELGIPEGSTSYYYRTRAVLIAGRPRMNGQSHEPRNADTLHSAYSARAHEYIDLLGDIDTTAPQDRALVTRWARGCTGRVVDVGCGPGHWTAYLTEAGVTAEGIDPVPEFVDHAQRTYPQVQFRQGTFDDLGDLPAPLGGVFSWYSLIHLAPGDVPEALATVRASLAPGGRLLLAFFDGDTIEEFPHAVAPAFYWPLTTMIDTVRRAGFAVTHRERRHDPGHRPHAALLAYRD